MSLKKSSFPTLVFAVAVFLATQTVQAQETASEDAVPSDQVSTVRPAPPVQFSEIVRHASGVWHMTYQSTAGGFCHRKGTRLPTAREFAEFATSRGACGILSPSEYASYHGTAQCPVASYQHIQVTPSIQELLGDSFYYSRDGYQPLSGDDYIFWSSSLHPENSAGAYGFLGGNGEIATSYISYDLADYAVRCVR